MAAPASAGTRWMSKRAGRRDRALEGATFPLKAAAPSATATVTPAIFSPDFNVIPLRATSAGDELRAAAPLAPAGDEVAAGVVIAFTYQFSLGNRGSRK